MWSIAFALIPKRYLIGTGLVLAALAAIFVSVAAYGHHRESKGYAAGYGRAADSVWVAETQHRQVLLDSMEAAADSSARSARRTDSLLPATRQHLVIQTVPLSVVRDSLKPELTVRVIVESVHDTVENVPLRAAQYWQQSDSIAGLAIHARDEWRSAYAAEHSARIGADSLSALWRTRALANIAPPAVSHTKRDAIFAALGGTLALVVRNNVHHR